MITEFEKWTSLDVLKKKSFVFELKHGCLQMSGLVNSEYFKVAYKAYTMKYAKPVHSENFSNLNNQTWLSKFYFDHTLFYGAIRSLKEDCKYFFETETVHVIWSFRIDIF